MNPMKRSSRLVLAVLLSVAPAGLLVGQEAEDLVMEAPEPATTELEFDAAPVDSELEPQELGRVEATIDEIDQLIALPAGARLREADEDPANPQDAFEQRGVENLLGTAPRFVYVPQGISPMIIPWVREQVVLEELQIEVNRLRSSGTPDDLQKALEISRHAIEQYGNNPNSAWARDAEVALLSALRRPDEREEEPVEVVTGPVETEVVLPAWIRENTRGVMYDSADPGRSMALVGRALLTPGERVPNYSQVVVKEIGQSTVEGVQGERVENGYVVYEFRNREFMVPVRETR